MFCRERPPRVIVTRNAVLNLRIDNDAVVTALSLGRKPEELEGTSAVAAKRRQQVAAVELAVAASRLTVPPFLLSLG